MYKQAAKQKLRVQTSKGSLSVEQLWDLSLNDLDALAVSLENEYKESGQKSFLVKKSVKDKTAKLKFDIVLDILNTKHEEEQDALQAKENKEFNAKIIATIEGKKEKELEGKSIKELTSMLR